MSFTVSFGSWRVMLIGVFLPLFVEAVVSVGSSVERLVACLGYVWFFGIDVVGEGPPARFARATPGTLRASLVMVHLLVYLLFSLVLVISLPD